MTILRFTASTCVLSFCLLVSTNLHGQDNQKPITNEDVIKLVKAGLPADTVILTINHSKTAFDTTPDAIIHLNQSGVTGPVLNALLNASQSPSPAGPIAVKLDSSCPDKSGVYFKDHGQWKSVFQAASAGSQVTPVFGGAKSSVVYIGKEAPIETPALPVFCFRDIKPDLGITVVKLDQKKDHRELQTSLYSGFLTPGVGSGVKMKNIIHVTARPVEDDDAVTLVEVSEPLAPGQYLVLAQNPVFASMPASVPMSMRMGIGYDFQVK